jgi:hypothetical protein
VIAHAGTTWVPSSTAAQYLGLSTAGLVTRRKREGKRHPRYLVSGPVCLYDFEALASYRSEWRDGRLR